MLFHNVLTSVTLPSPAQHKLAFNHRPEGKLRGTGARVQRSVSRRERRIQAINEAAAEARADDPPKLMLSYRDAANNGKSYKGPPRIPPMPSSTQGQELIAKFCPRPSRYGVSDEAIRRDLELQEPWRGPQMFPSECAVLPKDVCSQHQTPARMSEAVQRQILAMKQWLFIESFRFCNGLEEEVCYILRFANQSGIWCVTNSKILYEPYVVSRA